MATPFAASLILGGVNCHLGFSTTLCTGPFFTYYKAHYARICANVRRVTRRPGAVRPLGTVVRPRRVTVHRTTLDTARCSTHSVQGQHGNSGDTAQRPVRHTLRPVDVHARAPAHGTASPQGHTLASPHRRSTQAHVYNHPPTTPLPHVVPVPSGTAHRWPTCPPHEHAVLVHCMGAVHPGASDTIHPSTKPQRLPRTRCGCATAPGPPVLRPATRTQAATQTTHAPLHTPSCPPTAPCPSSGAPAPPGPTRAVCGPSHSQPRRGPKAVSQSSRQTQITHTSNSDAHMRHGFTGAQMRHNTRQRRTCACEVTQHTARPRPWQRERGYRASHSPPSTCTASSHHPTSRADGSTAVLRLGTRSSSVVPSNAGHPYARGRRALPTPCPGQCVRRTWGIPRHRERPVHVVRAHYTRTCATSARDAHLRLTRYPKRVVLSGSVATAGSGVALRPPIRRVRCPQRPMRFAKRARTADGSEPPARCTPARPSTSWPAQPPAADRAREV